MPSLALCQQVLLGETALWSTPSRVPGVESFARAEREESLCAGPSHTKDSYTGGRGGGGDPSLDLLEVSQPRVGAQWGGNEP